MKIIDLSVSIQKGMFVYPGDPEVDIEQLHTIAEDEWNMKRLHLNSHDGTHVNAQVHCVENGRSLDDYDLAEFCGNAVIYKPGVAVGPETGVVFREVLTMEIAKQLLPSRPKFFGLSKEADESVEKFLLKHDAVLFERLSNTEELPERFEFFGVPLKITDGDGSPVRAFAVVR